MFKRRYDKVNPGGRVWNGELDAIEGAAGDIAELLDEAYRLAQKYDDNDLMRLLAQSPKPLQQIMASVAELRRVAK